MSNNESYAWGGNNYGQLGYPSCNDNFVQVSNIDDVIASAGGSQHSLVLKEDGTVWAWGRNYSGQLGDGTNTDSNEPVQVKGLTNIIDIAAGDFHSLAIKSDGTAWAWGSNSNGQLGDGTTTNRNEPVQVSNITGLSSVIGISGGGYHSLAIKSDGTAWAWGYNLSGQLGDGTNTTSNQPVQVSTITGLSSVIGISGGGYYSLAIKSDGTAWTWGNNWYGQLGDGTNTNSNQPVQVSTITGLTSIKGISGGYSHSLAIKSDGTAWAWGSNWSGQLGDGTNTNRNQPVQVSTIIGLTSVIDISGGSAHSLAIKSDGTAWAWGRNNYGQLGDGTTTNSNEPVQISSLTNVQSVAAGGDHSLTIKNNGTMWVWGNNYYGQLGLGFFGGFSSIPVLVNSINNIQVIAAGNGFNLALKSDGEVRAWGNNWYGQLGDGTTGGTTDTPVLVVNLTNVIAVATGNFHSLALKNDGTVWAWGYNGYGQLGDGTNSNKNEPVQVKDLTNVKEISAGEYHSLAIKSDGTAWSWGNNWYGQIGDGTTSNRNQPVQVSNITGLTNVIGMSGGGYHSLAIKNDGTAWAWGRNDYGQLGDGTNTNSNQPVQVSNIIGLTNIIDISGGGSHSLALNSDGTAWAWGYNSSGQLGDGTNTNSNEPVQVSNITGLTKVIDISGGRFHSLAINSDGTVWAWGSNSSGQLGDGYYTNSNEPVQVSDIIYSIAIAAGYTHSLALKLIEEKATRGISFW